MKMIKRSAAVLGLLLVLFSGGVVALVAIVGAEGQTPIESWIGEELKRAVNAELKPDLEFASLDYRSPRTVILSGVKLVSDDPDNPGQRVSIIEADRLTIELVDLPRQGTPLKLRSLAFDNLVVRMIDSESGDFIGFDDLVEEQATETRPLSEILQITEITIRNGAIEYDPRDPELEPMRFDQIGTQLAVDDSEEGLYGLDLVIARDGVFDLKVLGEWDIDAMTLAVESMDLSMAVSRENDHYLPPAVQAFCRDYGLTGALTLTGTGVLDIEDAAGSQAQVIAELTEGHGRVADVRFPIERLTVEAQMAERAVVLDRLTGQVFDGELDGRGGFTLDDDMPARLTLTGNGLQLGELMAADETDDPDAVAGTIDLQVQATAPLTNLLEQMYGQGELRLSEGRIARLPMISDLADMIESVGEAEAYDPDAPGTDTGRFVFELRGDHAYLSTADIVGGWFAMRGRGEVHFDDRLAMNINAGPLERVQAGLGVIGSPFGRLTDSLLTYRVTGPLNNLTVRPLPLGGIIGAPGE